MLVYCFVPFIVSNRYLLFWVSNGHNSVTVQNLAHVYMNFFDHKDLGNHLLQLCPKVVKPCIPTTSSPYCSWNYPNNHIRNETYGVGFQKLHSTLFHADAIVTASRNTSIFPTQITSCLNIWHALLKTVTSSWQSYSSMCMLSKILDFWPSYHSRTSVISASLISFTP